MSKIVYNGSISPNTVITYNSDTNKRLSGNAQENVLTLTFEQGFTAEVIHGDGGSRDTLQVTFSGQWEDHEFIKFCGMVYKDAEKKKRDSKRDSKLVEEDTHQKALVELIREDVDSYFNEFGEEVFENQDVLVSEIMETIAERLTEKFFGQA